MGAHGKVATFQRVFALFDRARLSCRRMSIGAERAQAAQPKAGGCPACQQKRRQRKAAAATGRPVPPPPTPTLRPVAGDTYDPLKKFCFLSSAGSALRRLVHGDQGDPGTGVSHRALRCPLKHTAAVLFVTLPLVVAAQDDSPVSLRLHAGDHGFGAQVRWVVWGPDTPVYTRGIRSAPTAYVETGHIIGEMAVVPPALGVAQAEEGEMGPIEPTITEEPAEQDTLARVGAHLERNAGKYATALASALGYMIYEYGKESGSDDGQSRTQAAKEVALNQTRATLVAKQGAQISVKDAPQTEVPNLVAERDSRIEYDFQRAE